MSAFADKLKSGSIDEGRLEDITAKENLYSRLAMVRGT
jgi:hypothetical protein